MNRHLAIHGSGGHASVVADIAIAAGFKVVGFFDPHCSVSEKDNIPVYHTAAEAFELADCHFVAIGDNSVRERVVQNLSQHHPIMHFATLIHPTAVISRSSEIETGTVVMPNVVVNSRSRVAEHSILNTASILEHDCFMDRFSSLAPRVTVGGTVTIGRNTAIGIGATIRHRIVIGEYVVIGAGAYVNTDITNNVIAYGLPAKIIRARNGDERYL